MLLYAPVKSIKSIILGHKFNPALMKKILDISKLANCPVYNMKIGRTTSEPFFLSKEGIPHQFIGNEITKQKRYCRSCKEPLSSKSQKCSWCKINEYHIEEEAHRNSYRILDAAGILDNYLESVAQIDKRINAGK